MRVLLSIATLATAWTVGAQGTSEAIVDYSNPGGTVQLISGTGGWTFRPAITITVTGLGCFNYLFDQLTPGAFLQVGLWTSDGSLLASNSVSQSSLLSGQSRYESITPVSLSFNQNYHIGAYSTSGAVTMEIGGPTPEGSITMAPEVALGGTAKNTFGFGFPPGITNTGGLAYLGPNFQYQGRIPEPSSGLLLGLGALLLTVRRRDQPRFPK
jgi:hypothetical protein